MHNDILTALKHKQIIRTYMRSLRNSIKLSEQYVAAQLITNRILSLNYLNKSTNIAIFISYDGEVRTDLIIQILLSMNKNIYLPIISTIKQSQPLLFAQYTLSTPLIKNRFNIYEPHQKYTFILPIEMLDIIFIPLVAFDNNKNRLGMGGGFYDKTLHNKHKVNKYLMYTGLGYDFQKIPSQIFPTEQQDIQLSQIITPYNIY